MATIRDLEVPIGDAAQVRKALEVIRSKAIFMKGMYNVPNSLVANLMEIIAIANTALAAPARNCDVYRTHEEACKAWGHRLHNFGVWSYDPYEGTKVQECTMREKS